MCCFIAYEQCDGIADVIFAVHAPATLRPSDYRKEKEFVKMVARGLDIAPGRSRVGLILYSNFATVSAEIGAKTTLDSFQNLVDGLPHEKGKTRIDRALKLATSLFDPSASGAMRPGVPRILILLTNGKQTEEPDAITLDHAARPLFEADVRILVVGFGQNLDEGELQALALKEDYVFLAHNFDNLGMLGEAVSKITCQAASKY